MEVIHWDTAQNVYNTPGKSGLSGAAAHCCLILATGFVQPIGPKHIFKLRFKNCTHSAKYTLELAC